MNIKNLIEELEKFPYDAEVYIEANFGAPTHEVYEIQNVKFWQAKKIKRSK